MLYGLVHQRYILTRVGLQAMVRWFAICNAPGVIGWAFQAEKYENGTFGTCPRVYCVGCNVVPCGRVDIPGTDTVKLFCPNCNDIFIPPSSRFQGVDGQFNSESSWSMLHWRLLYRCLFWNHIRPSKPWWSFPSRWQISISETNLSIKYCLGNKREDSYMPRNAMAHINKYYIVYSGCYLWNKR